MACHQLGSLKNVGNKDWLSNSSILKIGFHYTASFPLDFILTREDIPVKDVSYYGMLDETIGYIRLNRFSKNSAIEVEKAITSLSNNNLSSIVLDLRDNPGGLLNSAVSILDMFIEKDELLVWTAGKARQSNKKYFMTCSLNQFY